MSEMEKKLLIIGTHAEESPDKATIPFVIGNAAFAMETKAVIILQSTAVYLAMKGYADHVHAADFPPLTELMASFFELGGTLMVCAPCIESRKITKEDLIPEVQIISGGTLVAESISADSVLTY